MVAVPLRSSPSMATGVLANSIFGCTTYRCGAAVMRSSQSMRLGVRQVIAEHRGHRRDRVGVVEDKGTWLGAHRGEPVAIAAPPRVDRRQFEGLAQQMSGSVGKERLQPQSIGQPTAERVGDTDVTLADRLQQTGDTAQPDGRSSSGSDPVSARRRNTTSICSRPPSVRSHTRPPRVIRSPLLAR